MLRCTKPGWMRIGVECSAGRRSLWLKVNDFNPYPDSARSRIEEIESFELCAGREGDDSHVVVNRSNPQFDQLLDVMMTALYATEI